MRIATLTASISRNGGGVSEAVRRLSLAITARGDGAVTIFSGEDEHSAADSPAWDGVPLHLGAVRGPRAFGWQPGLGRDLRAAAPDLVHLHGIWMYPSLATLRWSEGAGRPRIISPHGMLDPWALTVSPLKKRLVRALFEDRNLCGAAVLHALNQAEHDAMRAFGLKNPVAIIPNGVDLPPLGDHGPPPWAGAVPADARILLFLGRLHPKKGLKPLLHAFAAAQARTPALRDWRLVIAGWDQNGHRGELEALVRELTLERSVHFPGPIHGAAKNAALAAADAFILPSFSEGLPMAVLEAWSFARPVLMTRACNLPEGFSAGAALEIGTRPEELADSLGVMARLAPSGLSAMGAQGRALVQERFNWDHVAARMHAVYRWALEGGDPPPGLQGASP